MTHPTDVSDQQFEADVLQSAGPVLVDFWAPWCGPCRMVAPVVDALATDYEGRVKFVKVNVDDNPLTASQYQIRSIPTLLIFRDGQPVSHLVGARPKEDLQRQLDAALA